MRKEIITILSISGGLAVAIGGLMMYAAWNHNPQGEFHSDGSVHWANWLPIGLSWAVIVFVVTSVIGAIIYKVISAAKGNRKT